MVTVIDNSAEAQGGSTVQEKNLIEQFAAGLLEVVGANGPFYHSGGVHNLGDADLPPKMALAYIGAQLTALRKAVKEAGPETV